jgi:hypothetical protein
MVCALVNPGATLAVIRLSPKGVTWYWWYSTPFYLYYITVHTIHLYNMEDDREQRVDEAMIVEGNGDRERRESWKHLDTEGGAGGGGGWMDAWRMMGS